MATLGWVRAHRGPTRRFSLNGCRPDPASLPDHVGHKPRAPAGLPGPPSVSGFGTRLGAGSARVCRSRSSGPEARLGAGHFEVLVDFDGDDAAVGLAHMRLIG